MTAAFEMIETNNGRFRFQLKVNGQTVATSELYETKQGAESAARSVRTNAAEAAIHDLT
jgi:uncharacterized protein YegP (UPF0339 family)